MPPRISVANMKNSTARLPILIRLLFHPVFRIIRPADFGLLAIGSGFNRVS
jgi:hypothetical protein